MKLPLVAVHYRDVPPSHTKHNPASAYTSRSRLSGCISRHIMQRVAARFQGRQ
jgi:hypothetical protein